MLTLRGAPALSEFGSNKLLAKLQQHDADVSAVYAEFVHLFDVEVQRQ